MTGCTLCWWNVGNLFDDVDDPRTRDHVPSRRDYHRDLRELTEVLGVAPLPDLIALAEVENRAVLEELCAELRWHPNRGDFIVPDHIESRDPRGIDIGLLLRRDGALKVDRIEACWPADRAAVRPVVLVHARCGSHRLRIALIHSKSRRSGPEHRADPTPGSRIRFAYGRLLRSLAVEACGDGVPLVVLGDFNDEPTSHSLTDGAGARLGRPSDGGARGNRLYNLTHEAAPDSPGTHRHYGSWAYLDQVLVSGGLLEADGLRVVDRPRIRTDGPLLHRGGPNRWYSDHLPLELRLSV